MKKLFFVLLVLAAALAITPGALADTFSYSFGGSGLSTSLTFTGVSNGDGSYTITNVNGTVYSAGSDITSPVDINEAPYPDPNGTASNTVTLDGLGIMYDNQLFPTQSPVLDFGGVLFDVNGLYIDIFGVTNGVTSGYQWLDTGSYQNPSGGGQPIEFTPEPSSLLLLGTGLLGLMFIVFRKAKSFGLVLHS